MKLLITVVSNEVRPTDSEEGTSPAPDKVQHRSSSCDIKKKIKNEIYDEKTIFGSNDACRNVG